MPRLSARAVRMHHHKFMWRIRVCMFLTPCQRPLYRALSNVRLLQLAGLRVAGPRHAAPTFDHGTLGTAAHRRIQRAQYICASLRHTTPIVAVLPTAVLLSGMPACPYTRVSSRHVFISTASPAQPTLPRAADSVAIATRATERVCCALRHDVPPRQRSLLTAQVAPSRVVPPRSPRRLGAALCEGQSRFVRAPRRPRAARSLCSHRLPCRAETRVGRDAPWTTQCGHSGLREKWADIVMSSTGSCECSARADSPAGPAARRSFASSSCAHGDLWAEGLAGQHIGCKRGAESVLARVGAADASYRGLCEGRP
ncbi:hypothetical protein PsYK624_104670 [Phanerochaete sordida]|uniref:Uncharacterized protein n=1 Tax=Phanerochaete sordida TaxID=48140 RepID=A0A9P3GG45_9APHY|nr:hypothetical protein PsYK624_104670 [Phanerochaete sordida]